MGLKYVQAGKGVAEAEDQQSAGVDHALHQGEYIGRLWGHECIFAEQPARLFVGMHVSAVCRGICGWIAGLLLAQLYQCRFLLGGHPQGKEGA